MQTKRAVLMLASGIPAVVCTVLAILNFFKAPPSYTVATICTIIAVLGYGAVAALVKQGLDQR